MRPYSSIVLDGRSRAPSRAMLYPAGYKESDFAKPQIGVASTWSMVTPCNMHIDQLACESALGVDAAGGKAVIFNTITISDGISMGTEGMKYSLVSREVIADSIETVVGCQGFDGFVAIGGCDKNMPGCIMAVARMNRPAVFVYGGTILPGCLAGRNLDVVSVFEAVGQNAAGKISDKELHDVESCAIPGPGSCGGMYTANTMASAIEALGFSLPNSSAQAAVSQHKVRDCRDAGAAVLNLLKQGIRPSDIFCKEAFENAITVTIALGGLGKDVALITDGRFSGGTHGFVVGHITPEAFEGGPLAVVREGDPITIDAPTRKLTLGIPQKEIAARLAKWKKPAPRYRRGVLAKYASHVSTASTGAVTDSLL